MHTRIFPDQDSYIENTPNFFLKDFGRDELLEICVLNSDSSIYTSSLQSGSFNNKTIKKATVQRFVGTLTGSLSGSAEFITGSVIYYF